MTTELKTKDVFKPHPHKKIQKLHHRSLDGLQTMEQFFTEIELIVQKKSRKSVKERAYLSFLNNVYHSKKPKTEIIKS